MATTASVHGYLTRREQRFRDETIRLHYDAGLTAREVAGLFGLSPRAVIAALNRIGATIHEKHWRPWYAGRRRVGAQGYVFVKLRRTDPMMAMASELGWVREHRLIVARLIGRPLRADEEVHHKDGDRANNDPGNLQLRQGRHGVGCVIRCASCGSHNIEFGDL